jgi:hypothetical protein
LRDVVERALKPFDGIQRRERVQFGKPAVYSPPVPQVISSRFREAREAWDTMKTTTNIAVLEKFAGRYGDMMIMQSATPLAYSECVFEGGCSGFSTDMKYRRPVDG